MKCCLLCQRRKYEPFSFAWLFSLQSESDALLCQLCQSTFTPLKEKICTGCGREGTYVNYCTDCQRWLQTGISELLYNRALYRYNDAMKKYFEQFKFAGDYYLRILFKRELARFLRQRYRQGWLFVPIPVTAETATKRCFNQVEGLFENVTLHKVLYSKIKSKKQQSLLKRRARLQTPQPFAITSQDQSRLSGAKVVLVDDIYTTGRTLYHARAVLKAAGVAQIRAVTLAR
ncbi:ComF family protein [Liquorilactobacillus satsumensis]|uniref:ComF family protein n=1 Tax=Liquorilactobacillus satsumensis TaxID=259059 RepID=UPI0021C333B9|nr:phosphoribosyltransferase family protein [Liquorilactobacillus satsumensis]MCP9328214.1 ComF family protein [Liquorilactobacillus satsumensis]